MSFGDFLRQVARERGMKDNRETLHALGEEFAKDMTAFCASVLKGGEWKSGHPLVVDGIRHAGAVGALRSLITSTPFVLVYVGVTPATRQERFHKKKVLITEFESTSLRCIQLKSKCGLLFGHLLTS